MIYITRRKFAKAGLALAASIGMGTLPGCSSGNEGGAGKSDGPDMVLLNGRIYTIDPGHPKADAFAVKDGKFMAIGSTNLIQDLAKANTQVIDAQGMTVTPGFIDAHSHPASSGVRALLQVDCDLRSIAEIKDVLRARAKTTPAGEWILGFKYDDTKVKDGRRITRKDLDEAVPNNPVRVSHRGGHLYWYNSAAFKLAGITAKSKSPAGGKIYLDGKELNGLLAEKANDLIIDQIPSGSTREQRAEGVKLISEQMSSSGLTTVHDAHTSEDHKIAYEDAYAAGEMRFRVYMMLGPDVYEDLKAKGIRTGHGDDWLKVGGVKFTADGSASGQTMSMSTPYKGRPDDYGILTMTQEEIHEVVEDVHRSGFQIGIHANGDVAIDRVLNAYERVQKLWPIPDMRHRLEHCSLVNESLLKRIKAVGAIPTPFYTYVHFHGNKWGNYGKEKMRWMFAHRSFLDHGIPVAAGSDYVPGPFEPLMAIQSMMTRKDFEGRVWGPNQRITVAEALKICTINGAHASFEENIKGSITPGKLADFVVLEKDPHDEDPDHIKEIKVNRTVVGGKTMHSNNS